MDSAAYEELRLQLEERHHKLVTAENFLVKFAKAIEWRVNYDTGKKRSVCVLGSMTGDDFIEHEYDISHYAIGFTLKILFRDASGDVIFEALVHFKATYSDTAVTVTCLTSGADVVLSHAEAGAREGQSKVAALLDAPVAAAARKALGA